jgi:hypothetical protein
MTPRLFLISIGLGTLLLAANHAAAQGSPCASHDVVVERLADGYGESRQAMGLASNNAVIEVYASAASGSWTITVTNPGGPTCLVASGEGFQLLAEPLPNTDSAS